MGCSVWKEPEWTRYTKESASSSWRQSTAHWAVELKFSSPFISVYQKRVIPDWEPEGTRYIKESASSSRRRASVHRTLAFNFSSPFISVYQKSRYPDGDFRRCKHRKGLGTLRSRRRRAAAEQVSTGHLHYNIRVPPINQKQIIPNGMICFWYTGRDSNPQPSEPESDALSIEPPVHFLIANPL